MSDLLVGRLEKPKNIFSLRISNLQTKTFKFILLIPPIDLHLINEYWIWKPKLEELDFLSISNLNFAGFTGSENQVQNRDKLSSSNLIFQIQFFKQIGDSQIKKHILMWDTLYKNGEWWEEKNCGKRIRRKNLEEKH
jgi:hypothetical protein